MNNISLDNNNSNIMMQQEFVVPESLFESLDQLDYGHNNNNNNSFAEESLLELMDTDLMTSETMSSFLEMEYVKEVEPVVKPSAPRPSVIMKNTKQSAPAPATLSEILSSCGIEYDLVEDIDDQGAASPSSLGSEMEKTQDLIEELEDFFIKTEGSPTQVTDSDAVVPVEMMMMEQEMVKPNLVTDDGQQVLIIIAPSSPVDSDQAPVSPVSSDPDWSPSPVSPGSLVEETSAVKPRKKYARSKPPKAPVGPYPTDKKERKKAQNRTAAFRYREKMKSQQDMVEEEMEQLEEKNSRLKEKFSEMETEFKYLKKLMVEAGLGHYTAAVNF